MILLARHGETEFNVARRAQGLVDSPLTPLGVRQAHAMADLLADLVEREAGPWRMVSSPLGRAVATAEIFSARLGLPFTHDARLREHSMGSWDGLLATEFVPRFRTDVPAYKRAFHTPDGETLDSLTERLSAFLTEAASTGHVIAVSHGSAGRVLRGLAGGLDREAMLTLEVPHGAVFRLQNGQVDRFDCDLAD